MDRRPTRPPEAGPAHRRRADDGRLCHRRPPLTLYLDTSAAVKLFIEEEGTEAARTAVGEARVLASSVLMLVETRSAFARARAAGRLSASGHRACRSALDLLWSRTARIVVDEPLIEHAAQLAEQHILRAYDAMHLASALAIGEPSLELACWDDDLAKAAAREGLTLAARA